MSKEEAHALLDAAKQGLPVARYEILEALHQTGDLATRYAPHVICANDVGPIEQAT